MDINKYLRQLRNTGVKIIGFYIQKGHIFAKISMLGLTDCR